MSAAPRTLVVLCTYNEIENLPSLVKAIFQAAPNVEVLVVDDHSPDGTGTWCDEEAAREPRLSCLHRAGKLGLGTAILAGLSYGIEHGYQYVVNLDADWSHHPQHLPELLAGMDPPDGPPVDVMIGSRYLVGGGIQGWPWWRHVVSRSVNVLARARLGLKCSDCSGSYRCYRASKLADVGLENCRARGYVLLEELLWRLHRRGATFGETPILFLDRTKGRSKVNWREGLSALWTILTLPFGKS